MSSEPPAKKMKEMEQSTEEDLEFIAHSSTGSEKVTLDELVLFSCVSLALFYDHLILKCVSRRFAAIVQQQNSVQPVYVQIIDVERDILDESSCDYSRIFIDRYRSNCSNPRVAVTEEWTTCEAEDLERLLVLIFSQFRRFKRLQLQSSKMSALTDIFIYALSAKESFAPLQLDCLAIDGDFECGVDWYIIKRFSRLIQNLDVVWPRQKKKEEKRLFWNVVARCENLRQMTTVAHCMEDFFFFNNKFEIVADGAKNLHVKHEACASVVDMYFSVSPMAQENAATSLEVGIKDRKIQVQVRSHLNAYDQGNLLHFLQEALEVLSKDLSNVDVGRLFSYKEALLVNISRFLSHGPSIHVFHCPQFKEMVDDGNYVATEMFIAICLWLFISGKFDRIVNLMFLFLDVDSLILSFFSALPTLETQFDELRIVRSDRKPELTLTFRMAKVFISFSPV